MTEYKKSPAASCSRESLRAQRPNSIDGIEFIRMNARTIESASAKGYCSSSQTTIESHQSQLTKQRQIPIPRPFCKQSCQQETTSQLIKKNLEDIKLKIESFRKFDKDCVKNVFRNMLSMMSANQGVLYDFLEEESKAVLKYLSYTLYQEVMNNHISISQIDLLEVDLSQKKQQLKNLTQNLNESLFKFNLLKNLLEESKINCESLVLAILTNNNQGKEIAKMTHLKIQQINQEITKIVQPQTKYSDFNHGRQQLLKEKQINDNLRSFSNSVNSNNQGIVSRGSFTSLKEGIKVKSEFKENVEASTTENENIFNRDRVSTQTVDINGRCKNKLRGLKGEIERLEEEYSNLGKTSLSLAEQAEKNKRCFESQLRLCQKLEEENNYLDLENEKLFEENEILKANNQHNLKGISKFNNNTRINDNLREEFEQIENENQELRRINQNLLQKAEDLETLHENQNKKKLKQNEEFLITQMKERCSILTEKITILEQQNEEFQMKCNHYQNVIEQKEKDNLHLNKELTECVSLVEAGKASIDALRIALAKKKQNTFFQQQDIKYEDIAQMCILEMQDEQNNLANQLLQISDDGENEQLEIREAIEKVFGKKLAQFFDQEKQKLKNEKNISQNLKMSLLNEGNALIQCNEDIKVFGQIVLHSLEILNSQNHLPTSLRQLKEDLESKKSSVIQRVNQSDQDSQNLLKKLQNISNTYHLSQQETENPYDQELLYFQSLNAINRSSVGSPLNSNACSRKNICVNQNYYDSQKNQEITSSKSLKRSLIRPPQSKIENKYNNKNIFQQTLKIVIKVCNLQVEESAQKILLQLTKIKYYGKEMSLSCNFYLFNHLRLNRSCRASDV